MKSNPTLEKIAEEQVSLFHKENQTYVSMLIKKPALRFIMINVYSYMVAMDMFCRIEKIPENKKDILWKECEYLADGTLSEFTLAEFRKSLYTITSLL